MRIKNLYLIILTTLLLDNFCIAQIDTSFYGRFMEWSNYHSDKQIISTFTTNRQGESFRVDTVKYYYRYSNEYNKTYCIYFNGELYKKMMYYKNRLSCENFYEQEKNTKRMIYSKKRPYCLLRIVYFDIAGDRRTKIEYYNKEGELCKEIHGEEAENAPLEISSRYCFWKRLLKGSGKQITRRNKSPCK